MVTAVGEVDFKSGRHLAARLGLVLQQHSGGDERMILGIPK